MVVRFFNGRPDIRCAQHRKNEGLQKRDQQFEGHHEQGQGYGGRRARHGAAETGPGFSKDKNKADKAEDHNVAGGDVRKQTQQQGEGLQEQAQDFNGGQDQYFEHRRHTGHPQGVFPEVFVGAESRNEEGQQGEHDGNRNVTGHVGAAGKNGQLSDEVQAKDKKESRQQVGHVLFVFWPDVGFGHLVSDKSVEGFEEVLESFGRVAAVSGGRHRRFPEQEKEEQRRQQHGEHVAGDAEVGETGDAAAEDAAVVGGFGVEGVAGAVISGVVNRPRFAFGGFDFLMGRFADGDFPFWKARVVDAHHIAVYEDVAVFGDGAVAVVFGFERCGGGECPALAGGVQEAGQVEIRVADDVDGVGVGDVVYGIVAGVELLLMAHGVAAGVAAVFGTGVGIFMLFAACPLLGWLGGLFVAMVLCCGNKRQSTENQYEPIFPKNFHIRVKKGFFKIGRKGMMRFWFKKIASLFFPKKMGKWGRNLWHFGI